MTIAALVKSVVSVGLNELSGGVAFNVRIYPSYIESEERLDKLAALQPTGLALLLLLKHVR